MHRPRSSLLALAAAVLLLSACGSTADDSGDADGDTSGTTAATGTTAPPTGPPSTDPISTTDPSQPAGDDRVAALTTAGSFGVTVGVPDGSESTIVTEPMAFAATAADGRVFMQRSTEFDDAEADTTLLVWSPETKQLTPLDPPLAADSGPDDAIELHDVATVDGAVTVLYVTRPGRCTDPNECVGAVMAWEPDTGESTEIASKIVFEGGWSGLELADNGLVVGAEYESAANAVFLATVGSVAAPTPADLGLESAYVDCSVCPFAFTVDPSGRYIGWVDSGPDVDQANPPPDGSGSNDIAVVDLAGEGEAAGPRRVGVDLAAAFGELDIADIAFGDGDGFTAGRAVFRSRASGADAPVEVDLTSGRIDPIGATSATLNELDR
ncbi:MAG: hypothetical protein R2761_17280 [Acidimicrobiales bacterium]